MQKVASEHERIRWSVLRECHQEEVSATEKHTHDGVYPACGDDHGVARRQLHLEHLVAHVAKPRMVLHLAA